MTTKIQEVLNEILIRFEKGDIPEAIAYGTFPIPDIPSSNWSFLNRTLMFLAGTVDGRGFRQWQLVNRRVRKGAKAFYILVPRIVKCSVEEVAGPEVLSGFLARPVFRLEDTEGTPLDYEQQPLPELPLIAKATEWGISVKTIPGNYRYYGYFSSERKEIGLASKEESVFFHELAHSAHNLVLQKKNRGGKQTGIAAVPDWEKEIVAELSAAALCRIVGKDSKHLGTSYQYIRHFAEKAKSSPVSACLKVMKEVEQVLGLILR